MFGYGALIADILVVWPDGKHVDVLQKIHQVGPNLLAGFAGSVELGFFLIDDMRTSFQRPTGELWYPRAATWWWWRRARRAFAACPTRIQKLGSSLLLVGPDPHNPGPWPRARCIRMRSPDFRPEYLPSVSWHSIGSGSEHEAARHYAEDYRRTFLETHGQFELGPSRGGATFSTAGSVHLSLVEGRKESVSEALIFGTAFLNGCELSSFKSTDISPDGKPRTVQPGELLSTWEEFQKYAALHGLSAAAASTGWVSNWEHR